MCMQEVASHRGKPRTCLGRHTVLTLHSSRRVTYTRHAQVLGLHAPMQACNIASVDARSVEMCVAPSAKILGRSIITFHPRIVGFDTPIMKKYGKRYESRYTSLAINRLLQM